MTMNRIEVIEKKKKKIRKRVRSESSNFTLVWFSVLSCMVGVVWCCVVLCGVVVSPLFLFFSVLVCGCKERKEQKEKRERERYRHRHRHERERERKRCLRY